MIIPNFLNIVLLTVHIPFVIDSTIYSVDIQEAEIVQQNLNSYVIDYSIDDFLYVLTKRYLYKIDPDNLAIKDRIPLPQRFNYLSTNIKYVMLVTTGEIILLNKVNLAYRSGIGIEHGDYRPIILPQDAPNRHNLIHLMVDSGDKTVLKIYDLGNGKVVRKITVNKIRDYEYDPKQNIFITLDISNVLTVYDIELRKIKTIKPNINGKWFDKYENHYLIYGEQGIFFVDDNGKLLDFQPVLLQEKEVYEKFTFLTKSGIVHLDSLTLRPKLLLENDNKITKLLHTDYPNYVFGLDANYNFYLIDTYRLTIKEIKEKRLIAKTIEPLVHSTYADSLWYFQLGAFAHIENAFEMYNKLRHNNIPVFIDSTNLYRLKFGGFQDKIVATEIIENAHLNGWFIFQPRFEIKDTIEFMIGREKYIFEDGIIRED